MKTKLKGLLKDGLKGLMAAEITPDARQAGAARQTGAGALSLPRDLFGEGAGALKAEGYRLVAEWATDESALAAVHDRPRGFAVYAAYNKDAGYLIIGSDVPADDPVFPSLTGHYVAAYRFERQIQSLMGLTPTGHPDLRPWIKHEDWPEDAYPLRKSFNPKRPMPRVKGEYKWIRAEGLGVFEIPVGPVHAGIIEPGHFRFQAVGEDIINLETRFGYVHKGIEKLFESMTPEGGARLAARVSGDTTVAHSTAYAMAVEAASGATPPERAMHIRAILLERERIANHLGDIGAICNDTAFTFMLYQTAMLRERMLKTNQGLFGHRLTMDKVVPGGVAADITQDGADEMYKELDEVSAEFERLVAIYEDHPTLEDRVYSTGILTPETAREIGAVGFVGRASGQRLDARIQTACPPYDRIPPKPPLLASGDVHARTWVRIEEVRDSIRLIREMLRSLPSTPGSELLRPCRRMPEGIAGFSAVEGWRGEIIYWLQAGKDGRINRCMVRDPSSVNWLSIEQAIKGNIVPDFPLCNKSFNQSYSGHDL